jgi:hypothetical protein
MEEINVGNRTCYIRFPGLLRPLSTAEQANLEASIQSHGVLHPIHTDDENGIIDGIHRARIAAKLGITPEFREHKGLTPEQKRQLALSLNLDRRHLTEEEQERARAQRLDRVATKRREGKSTRTIAKEEGISQSQVVKDLRSAGEHRCSPGDDQEQGDLFTSSAPVAAPATINNPADIPDTVMSTLVDNGSTEAALAPQHSADPNAIPATSDPVSTDAATPPPGTRTTATAQSADGKVRGQDGKCYTAKKERQQARQFKWLDKKTRKILGKHKATYSKLQMHNLCCAPPALQVALAQCLADNKVGNVDEAKDFLLRTVYVDRPTSAAGTPPSESAQSVGVNLANKAINCLKEIPPDDASRERAFRMVAEFVRYSPAAVDANSP